VTAGLNGSNASSTTSLTDLLTRLAHGWPQARINEPMS